MTIVQLNYDLYYSSFKSSQVQAFQRLTQSTKLLVLRLRSFLPDLQLPPILLDLQLPLVLLDLWLPPIVLDLRLPPILLDLQLPLFLPFHAF